jgi:hypothetical protein
MTGAVGLDGSLIGIRAVKDTVDVAVGAVVSPAVDLVVERVDGDVDGVGACY